MMGEFRLGSEVLGVEDLTLPDASVLGGDAPADNAMPKFGRNCLRLAYREILLLCGASLGRSEHVRILPATSESLHTQLCREPTYFSFIVTLCHYWVASGWSEDEVAPFNSSRSHHCSQHIRPRCDGIPFITRHTITMDDVIIDTLRGWGDNLQRNVSNTLSNMTLEKYIRMVVIVGAYALLRPYIMKLGGKFQTREHEKEVDEGELAAAAKLSPNSLRGKVQVAEDTDSEGEEEEAPKVTGADWGKKARRRQRQMVRKLLEAEEELRREYEEDEEDKDIQEFLVDN